jgi:hypothetical protein
MVAVGDACVNKWLPESGMVDLRHPQTETSSTASLGLAPQTISRTIRRVVETKGA